MHLGLICHVAGSVRYHQQPLSAQHFKNILGSFATLPQEFGRGKIQCQNANSSFQKHWQKYGSRFFNFAIFPLKYIDSVFVDFFEYQVFEIKNRISSYIGYIFAWISRTFVGISFCLVLSENNFCSFVTE